MVDEITTKSITKKLVETDGVLLDETADTALVFFPQIHDKGVRGELIRFKKIEMKSGINLNSAVRADCKALLH